jgi:hypothetical protein
MVTDINNQKYARDDAHHETSGAPLQPNPDGVAEHHDDYGDSDDAEDDGMGAKAFH